MNVKKAVIPSAGYGTRVLPASKAFPKELYPIVDKPAIQYIVEEAASSGIEDILIILSRGKSSVEDYFDRMPELEQRLLLSGREKEYSEILQLTELANISYIRQGEQKGLGHAIWCARSFVGDEPFAVLYGDDVITGDVPACRELCDAYERYSLGIAGIKEVSPAEISRYCSLKVSALEPHVYSITDMIEKPRTQNDILSLFSIMGRCVLTPEIFPVLAETRPGSGGEIQLTDAMAVLARKNGMIGVEYSGRHHDMGSKLEIVKTVIEEALKHPEIGKEFRNYLKNYISPEL